MNRNVKGLRLLGAVCCTALLAACQTLFPVDHTVTDPTLAGLSLDQLKAKDAAELSGGRISDIGAFKGVLTANYMDSPPASRSFVLWCNTNHGVLDYLSDDNQRRVDAMYGKFERTVAQTSGAESRLLGGFQCKIGGKTVLMFFARTKDDADGMLARFVWFTADQVP